MSFLNTFLGLAVALFGLNQAWAQSAQYQRPKAKTEASAKKGEKKGDKKAAPASSDKVDISDLEKKYWAPKDTDFSVVQNRTYTKEKRFGVSLMAGPLVNDPFNEGYTSALKVNYYKDERSGFEFTFMNSDLTDGESTSSFRKGAGGGFRPDFNRETTYYGIGYNWVPIYAKVSVLGKKILYFDLQVTPHIGLSSYEQQSDESNNGTIKDSFSYGLDITQYFFVHKNFAFRFDLHNRWYDHEVLGYTTGLKLRDANHHTSIFLLGLTYFH